MLRAIAATNLAYPRAAEQRLLSERRRSHQRLAALRAALSRAVRARPPYRIPTERQSEHEENRSDEGVDTASNGGSRWRLVIPASPRGGFAAGRTGRSSGRRSVRSRLQFGPQLIEFRAGLAQLLQIDHQTRDSESGVWMALSQYPTAAFEDLPVQITGRAMLVQRGQIVR